MSTPNKCPKCGADSVGNHGEGWFSCGSHRSHKEPSPLCLERTAHAETRKREDALKLQFDQAVAQRDFWETTCDEKDAEIAKEHAAHAETRKERDELRSWFKAAQDNYESVLEQLTRDRKKWEKLMDWANSLGWKDNSEFILKEVNRLDVEAKETTKPEAGK